MENPHFSTLIFWGSQFSRYLVLLVALLTLLGPCPGESWASKPDAEWGGQINGQGTVSQYDGTGEWEEGGGSFYDGSLDMRLKGTLFFSPRVSMTVHYEAASIFIDPRPFGEDGSLQVRGAALNTISDDRRLFDFSRIISREDHRLVYHRLDRFFVSCEYDAGFLRAGRQALTWGNGMVFNPMDILNPFAPTDIVRDYKIGDDMVVFQTFGQKMTDLQLVGVPRRNPETGDPDEAGSSVAVKTILRVGEKDVELMAARHYRDYVAGAGINGYLGGAAWRTDATWTRLEEGDRKSSYFSAVANLDYSLTIAGYNGYGLIEAYYNGLGGDDPATVLSDPAVAERVLRGELFVTGKFYLAGQLRFEAHPLVNLHLSAIYNTEDASGIMQPYLVWDAAESVRIIAGGDFPAGGRDTEFGGYWGESVSRRLYIRGTCFF